MLPRRSMVLRYLTCLLFPCTVFFLWATGPSQSESFLLRLLHQPLNETALRNELGVLERLLNVSVPNENRTVEELFGVVQNLRALIPVNPHDFHYIINPTKVCADNDIFLLTYVHSAPAHYKRRMVIRETWGHPRNNPDIKIRVVFILGFSDDKNLQDAVHMESDMYGDIVQEDFLDSYRNLTYKAIAGLKWISKHCSNARFILKTDDDIFVNIFSLVAHLRSVFAKSAVPNKLLLCLVWYHMKVVRDPKSKWYIPYHEFKDDYFPTYCSGSAFIMTPDVVRGMYNASLHTPFFWVDDFYVTGLLAKQVGVEHTKFNSVYVLGPSTFLQKWTEEDKWRTLVFGHVHNLNYVSQVWNMILEDRKSGSDKKSASVVTS
jgi:beta-1,3-galactosyltransferase 1